MIPLCLFPTIVACGNTCIMKPSEQVPSTTMALVELLHEAGLPPGVINVIHGREEAVNFICDHPAIRAVSFIGGGTAGQHVYDR